MNQSYFYSQSLSQSLIGFGIVLVNTFFLFLPAGVKALTPEKINELASKIVVGISGANQASGVIISKNQNIYGVLTTREAIKQEGNNVLMTADGEIHFVREKKPIAQTELAIIYFESSQDYPIAQISLASPRKTGEQFYLAGYSWGNNNPKPQYRFYQKELVSANSTQSENQSYQLSYLGAGLPGMSGSAILDQEGRLVGLYGKTLINPNNLEANLLGISIDNINQSLQQAGIRLSDSVATSELPNNSLKPELISPTTNLDYSSLRNLLAAERWKDADETTLDLMLTSVKRSDQGWFSKEVVTDFPCDDLKILDQLWSRYSDNRFGFQVQKEIYLKTGNNLLDYDVNNFKNFAASIGWYKDNDWIPKNQLNYSKNAPNGHLPASSSKRLGVYLGLLFSTCKI
jgi:hypothetical protein